MVVCVPVHLPAGCHPPSTILMTLQSFLCLVQVLFLLGTLVIAMSLQLDRRGIWNTIGPCLFAFVIMAFMWVRSREVSGRREPHPQSCSDRPV